MTLLILLGALIAERYLLDYQQLRNPLWLEHWLAWQQSLPFGPGLRTGLPGLLGVLIPPLLLVAAGQWLLGDAMGGLAGALFAGLVLLYSLGPLDLDSQVQELSAAVRAGEPTRVERAAMHLVDDIPPDMEDPAYFRHLAEAILLQAQGRLFGVVIWFLLLGPVGALGYRLASELYLLTLAQSRDSLETSAATLLQWMDWLPARVVAALFALAGSFEETVQAWRHCDPEHYADQGKALVLCAGNGALRMRCPPSVEELRCRAEPVLPGAAMGLVWRSLFLLIALLALASLSAWLA